MSTSTGFGVNVWWTLPETSVDGIRAQTLLAKHGFNPTDIRLPSRQAEVSRAAHSFQNRRGKSNRRVTERVLDTTSNATYGILEREQAGEEASFAQHTTVRLNKDSGQVAVEGALKDAFLKTFVEFQGKVTDQDIRYFLRKVIRMSFGVAKRPSGGIYFVPENFVPLIKQAQALLADFNTNARIYVEEIVNNVETRQNVWASVEEDVEARVAEAVAALGRMERRSAIAGQRDKIKEAEDLMQVYKQLLGEEAKFEAAAEKIEEAVRAVTAKMEEMQPAPMPKVPQGPKATGVKSGVTVIEATVQVLTKAGKPLSYREIVDLAVSEGLYGANCTTPYNSFNGTLIRAIKLGDKRVERVGRGVYQLVAA